VVRGLSNTSELGLTCSCSLTSRIISVSDTQLLRLLALGVTGAVGFVDSIGRVVCVCGLLGWPGLSSLVLVILSSPALFYDCLVVVYWGGRHALSAFRMPLAYILVRRRDLINVMVALHGNTPSADTTIMNKSWKVQGVQ